MFEPQSNKKIYLGFHFARHSCNNFSLCFVQVMKHMVLDYAENKELEKKCWKKDRVDLLGRELEFALEEPSLDWYVLVC